MDRICTNDYNLGKPNDSATEDYIVSYMDSIPSQNLISQSERIRCKRHYHHLKNCLFD